MSEPLFYPRLGARAIGALGRAGALAPVRPDRLARMLGALRLGTGAATASAVAAARHPDHPALVDERGSLTYAELDRRAAGVAAGLRADFGVGEGAGLAVMCRNHRGFVEALLAGSRLGADVLLLNTEFPGAQLAEVLEREDVRAAVLDQEFAEAFDAAGFPGQRILGRHEDDPGQVTLDELAGRDARGSSSFGQGRITLLTSGTTGTPKGAPRKPSAAAMVGPMTTLLSSVGLRAREPVLLAPPLFHGLGLGTYGLALFLGSTVVLRRRFDAEETLGAIEENRVALLVAVPVMLQRIAQLPAEVRRRYDTSSLRAVISGGSALPGVVSTAFMDEFGDILFNFYGSTEAGFGAIAGPADLRAAPGTVGRPPFGTTLRVLGDDGREAPRGETGRIFIGGELVFEGYSGGGSKEVVDGLMSTGDLGHIDAEGRLLVDGREDDMIVSGGENVFPQEVEDALARHDAVADVAVVGVEDEEFGQRLRAFVVRGDGKEASEDDLKAHVKSKLARYKVPRDFVFVEDLPRNPTGKVLRGRLEDARGAGTRVDRR